MTYPYRCSKAGCRKRVSLPQHVEDYKKDKLCPSCGCDSLKFDRNKRKYNRINSCDCAAYHFPHRAGSGVWCDQSTKQPTEQDYIERYGNIA